METFKINRIPRILQLTGTRLEVHDARHIKLIWTHRTLVHMSAQSRSQRSRYSTPGDRQREHWLSGLWEGTRLHSAVNHDHVKVIRLEVANWDVVTFVIIINIFHIQFSPLFLLYRTPERFVIMLVLMFLAALLSVQHSSAETMAKVREF